VAARVEAFVCLSGGLDSTGIAVLVREHFRNVVAVGFDLQRPDGRMSEDRQVAERLARDLDLPLLEADVTEDRLFDMLDTVLVEGIDWRDFNVHAGLVNAVLAQAIAGATTDVQTIVSPATWRTSSWPITKPKSIGVPPIIASRGSSQPHYGTVWCVVSTPPIGR